MKSLECISIFSGARLRFLGGLVGDLFNILWAGAMRWIFMQKAFMETKGYAVLAHDTEHAFHIKNIAPVLDIHTGL